MRKSIIQLTIACSALSSTLCVADVLVLDPDDPVGGTFIGEGFVRTAGYEFAVGDTPLLVTGLGVRDWFGTGLVNSHDAGLWDVNQNLLAQLTVSPGPSLSGFRYASLTTPVLLNPNQIYIVGSTYVHMDPDRIGLADTRDGASPVYHPAVTFQTIRFDDSRNGLTFPTLLGYPVEVGLFGPNVEFQVVPEPSAVALMLAGGAFLFVYKCRTQTAKRAPIS